MRAVAKFNKTLVPKPKSSNSRTEFANRVRSLSLTDALMAAAWLNKVQRGSARERIVVIRQELEELSAELARLNKHRNANKSSLGRDYYTAVSQFTSRAEKLNQTLARYTFRPFIAYDLVAGQQRSIPLPRRIDGPKTTLTLKGTTVTVHETTVAAALGRLAESGELHKLRLCEQCKSQWRVSERRKDRFCSKSCCDEANNAKPEVQKRRRKAQQARRDKEKKDEIESRESAARVLKEKPSAR